MKIICDDISSKEIVDIFFHFDENRERYIRIDWVHLTKGTSSRREKPGDPLKQESQLRKYSLREERNSRIEQILN